MYNIGCLRRGGMEGGFRGLFDLPGQARWIAAPWVGTKLKKVLDSAEPPMPAFLRIVQRRLHG